MREGWRMAGGPAFVVANAGRQSCAELDQLQRDYECFCKVRGVEVGVAFAITDARS